MNMSSLSKHNYRVCYNEQRVVERSYEMNGKQKPRGQEGPEAAAKTGERLDGSSVTRSPASVNCAGVVFAREAVSDELGSPEMECLVPEEHNPCPSEWRHDPIPARVRAGHICNRGGSVRRNRPAA